MAENFTDNPEAVRLAAEAAFETGAEVPSNGVCAALAFLAKATGAKSVVEIGTGTGVTGLALLTGMTDDGVLTSIGAEADWQNEARRAWLAAGFPEHRFRLIAGVALSILPRLRDEAYDVVFVNQNKLEYVECVAQAARLLRPGGVLVLNDVLWHNQVADPADESDDVFIIREALQAVQADDAFTAVIIPLGEGLLAAAKN